MKEAYCITPLIFAIAACSSYDKPDRADAEKQIFQFEQNGPDSEYLQTLSVKYTNGSQIDDNHYEVDATETDKYIKENILLDAASQIGQNPIKIGETKDVTVPYIFKKTENGWILESQKK